MIRQATVKDLKEVIEIVNALADSTGLPRPDKNTFIPSWAGFIDSGMGAIFVQENKNIVGVIATNDFNSGVKVAIVSLWYVFPEIRGKGMGRTLLKIAEDWAKKKECKFISYSKHVSSQAPNKNSYTAKELMFIKEI